jgi:hypothetical protein
MSIQTSITGGGVAARDIRTPHAALTWVEDVPWPNFPDL